MFRDVFRVGSISRDSAGIVFREVGKRLLVCMHFVLGDETGERINFAASQYGRLRSIKGLAEFVAAISTRMSRSVTYIHMPVPLCRGDDAFFAPFRNVPLKPSTKLTFLIHDEDGGEGALRRTAATQVALRSDFGVAFEFGLGWLPRAVIPTLLDFPQAVAQL